MRYSGEAHSQGRLDAASYYSLFRLRLGAGGAVAPSSDIAIALSTSSSIFGRLVLVGVI